MAQKTTTLAEEAIAVSDAAPQPATQEHIATPEYVNQQINQQQQVSTTLTDSEVLQQIQQAIDTNTHPSDLVISRIAIEQPLSPEIADKVPGYQEGMLIDNVTRQILTEFILPPWLIEQGVDPKDLKPMHCMLIVPIFKLPTEFIEWIPRKECKETDEFPWRFKTLDRNDPRVKAGTWRSLGGTFKGKKPPVTDNTNFLIGVLDRASKFLKGNPLVNTFSRTSASTGRQLATMLEGQKMQRLMYWDRCYWVYTKYEKFDEGGAYLMQLARGPLLKDVADPLVRQQAIAQALALSDPKTGHLFQTVMINAAYFGDDHGTSEGENATGTQAVPEDDPFTSDAGAQPKF